MNQTYMKEKPILQLVLSMSLPMVISMMVNSLYNIVDSFFIARISEDAMTALSLVYPVQNLIIAVTVGFAIGINAVISFHLGAGDQQKADAAASQGLFLNTIHGILLTVGCIAVMPVFLKMFTSDPVVTDLSLRYSNIAFAFSVIISLGVSFEKIFQSAGKMTVSMISMLSGCIANIILDPIMIFGMGPVPAMGIEGAAWATGIGQTLSLVIYLAVYLKKPLHVKIDFRHLTLKKELNQRLYSIGIPATLSLALPSLLVSSLNGILTAFSQSYVLVLGIYYKLQTFLYLPANGIIQGIRPLIGYNYGAGEHRRVKSIYSTSLLLSALIMILGTALCLLIPEQLMGLFTTNAETIQNGAAALRIISIGFIASSVSVTSCGALEGLGMGTPSLMISLSRYMVIIIPTAFLLSRLMGAAGVWYSFGITEVATAVLSYYIYHHAIRRGTSGSAL
ncbi:MAG: MATE family efflux transporter [Clostridiales bacterium]|nr:MATE family efflux transporter [Clostridiales bacterium]